MEHGWTEALMHLQKFDINSALFVFDYYGVIKKENKKLINKIHDQKKRSQPVLYLSTKDENNARKWEKTPSKDKTDLVTNGETINGFEHPAVVLLQQSGNFQHNVAMRAQIFLIVVNFPEEVFYQIRI